MAFYYIVPAKKIYAIDENNIETDIIDSIVPICCPSGSISDCINGQDFLLKTNEEISGFEKIPDDSFDEVISGIGINPDNARRWGE